MAHLRGKVKFNWLVVIFVLLATVTPGAAEKGNSVSQIEGQNSTTLSEWANQGYDIIPGVEQKLTPNLFHTTGGTLLSGLEERKGYDHVVLRLNAGDSFEVDYSAPAKGLYTFYFDYYLLDSGLSPNQYRVEINGSLPNAQIGRVDLLASWQNETYPFPRDRYGNEVIPTQKKMDQWQTGMLTDPVRLETQPLAIPLEAGKNHIKVTLMSGSILSGDMTISSVEMPVPYNEYRKSAPDTATPAFLWVHEAEETYYKNDNTINPVVNRALEARPYDTNRLLLNTLGGTTWKQSGQAVYYEVEVPHDGNYQIGIKYSQDLKPNSVVFRTFTIDGKVPFREMGSYPFSYQSGWKTEILSGPEGAYQFHLTKGKHLIGIIADASPYRGTIETLKRAMGQINDLTLQIRKLVGPEVDALRDFTITDNLPNLQSDLLKLANDLQKEYEKAVQLNSGQANSQGIITLETAIRSLKNLAAEPNKIPQRLSQLNEGTGSVTQSISLAMQEFQNQPLLIDQIYLFTPGEKLPDYGTTILQQWTEGFKRFFHSFFPVQKMEGEDSKTIQVWVNRPRNYIDLMQRKADEEFTPKTGIKVNFTMMPNEQRLILANASGTAPDIALGISNWLPYELGVRGAALDLNQFPDFKERTADFSPGAFLPFIVNDQVYAMPETQDFYVLFYRKDILNSLKLPIPDTWQDVKELLPEMQRYGMSFYIPLAGSGGMKPLMSTSPFIYQSGGDLYADHAFKAGLDSEKSLSGIRLMTELFTLYGLPMQVPNFFEHFRDGTIPMGVSNFATYVQLQIAAPELDGEWGIALSPGIRQNGETVRWQTGSAQAAMIFKSTKHPEASWEFLKWWESRETQSSFGIQMQSLYGKEYMWNTANLKAFQDLPWPEEDKKVILEQWKWLREVPKTPGSYYIERELSNIWTHVVLDGKNLRATVEDSVNVMNKEIARKMEEFGYLKNGKVVRPYRVPTLEEVESWVRR